MLNRFLGGVSLGATILRNAEGGAGGGGGEGGGNPPAGDPPSPESVLFPDDKKAEGDPPAGDKKEGEGDPPAGDDDGWKEYEPDPKKSDEENAAAKAEHDKKKPAASDDDKKKAEAEAKAGQVPEDGKYEFAMPEGVELNTELADAMMPRFKELGLTRGQAQGLVDDYIKAEQKRVEGQVESWVKRVDDWAEAARADKTMGGDKWDATKGAAVRAINAFGSPELKTFLNESGVGNHPELIRVFAKVGATIREDDPAQGGAGGASKPADPAHVLFPNDAPKG